MLFVVVIVGLLWVMSARGGFDIYRPYLVALKLSAKKKLKATFHIKHPRGRNKVTSFNVTRMK